MGPARLWMEWGVKPEAMLGRISYRLEIDVDVVDIDSNPDLQRRYVFEIPVVVANGAEVARAPIFESALEAALEELFEGR